VVNNVTETNINETDIVEGNEGSLIKVLKNSISVRE
jgi:hypothetical protein